MAEGRSKVLHGRAGVLLSRLREFYERQVLAHERHLTRHEVSGQDALASTRRLRWDGRELVGDLLPPG